MLETLTLTGGATTALASGSFGITQSAGLKTAGTIPTTLNVNLNGVVTSLTDTSDQYTAMNIATLAGGAILSLDATKVAELNFTGPKGITIASVASLVSTAAITSGDGGVTISSQLNANQSFTGGAGKDSISLGATTKAITTGAGDDTVTATASLGTGGSIDAGEGDDTLSLSAADAATVSATAAYEAKISGFEKLSIGSAATTATVNTANLDDINDVTVGGVAAGQTLTVSGLSTGTKLTANAGAVGTVVASLAQPTGTADELNVAVTAKTAQTIGGLTATGYEVINFATSKSTATTAIQHVLSGLTAGDATTITVTGTAGLTLGNNFTGTKLTSYDASGVTGTGVVTYTTGALAAAATIKGGAGGDNLNAAAAKKAVTIQGNAGNDTIVGSTAAANTLEGGAGNDSLTGGGKADTIDGGEGTDTFIMTSSTATGSGTVDGMAINLGDVAIPQSTVYAAVSKFLTSAAPSLAASSATDLFSTESTTNASIVDTLTSIENVTTGAGIDFVVGSAGTNVIITDDAADYVSAGAGDDYIKADVAADADVDVVDGGTGNDTFVYSDATADIYVESATGGVDTILVNGNLSIATLKTGASAATAAVGALSNFEQIVVGTGNTATVIGAQLSTLTINVSEVAAGTSAVVVTATGGGTTDLSNLTFNASTYVDATGTMVASNAMTSGTDLITINGGAGAETITGSSIADVIVAGDGIDTLNGGSGADTFAFDTIILAANANNIGDFDQSALDVLRFDATTFDNYTAGATAVIATVATVEALADDASADDDYVIVDTAANIAAMDVTAELGGEAFVAIASDTGAIYYADDGDGGDIVQIGSITAAEAAALAATNILFVA
jgi:Ca2+-binding RTX toxin-like protein